MNECTVTVCRAKGSNCKILHRRTNCLDEKEDQKKTSEGMERKKKRKRNSQSEREGRDKVEERCGEEEEEVRERERVPETRLEW